MKVLFVTTEAVPFAKVGGLGDVSGALPIELAKLGVEVSVVLPFYRHARVNAKRLEATDIEIPIELGQELRTARIWRSNLPNSEVPIYFVQQDDFYDREGIYTPRNGKYKDQNKRFIFFNLAVLEVARALGGGYDVIHANDWMTGLVSIHLRALKEQDPLFKETVSILTIHNLGSAGPLNSADVALAGLTNREELEGMTTDGRVSLLKGALIYSDVITTVSRQYASEIQTEEFGEGLEAVLQSRAGDLFGVINGIDYSVWDPETDGLIPHNYSAADLSGKAACKASLQRENRLPVRDDVPLFAVVCRLCDQKGLDLLMEIMDDFLALDTQLVLLGTGSPKYESFFEKAAKMHPDRVAARIGFDEAMAHRIEAGADIFLMPSKFEPCGLNQMISLKYGTIPVVRRTGGLADTIEHCATENLATANGFSFDSQQGSDFLDCIKQAIALYRDRDAWKRLELNGMRQDWSWGKSAVEYADLYENACSRKRAAVVSR